jgi:alpha-amylase
MAVVLSNGGDGTIEQPNHTYMDITEHIQEPIITNDDGWAGFHCNGGSVFVWVLLMMNNSK